MADTHGQPRGAFYVGARAVGVPGPAAGAVLRVCVACGEDVVVEAGDVGLADSCTAVMCTECTGTAAAILYIAP